MRLLLHPRRCRARDATARHMTMYLMHVMLGRSLAEIGRFFGRDPTTVSYACGRIEDRREHRRFDARVARLEREIAIQILGKEEGGIAALEDHRDAA
jgi:chromosomal replication initiation ATPase DnaA